MKLKQTVMRAFSYLKDYRFSSIWLKYFLLLLICLVLPVSVVSIWYGKQMRQNVFDELMRQNEYSLEQSYDNVNSVILSAKNLIYSLAVNNAVQYVATRTALENDSTDNPENMLSMLSLVRRANNYIDSIYLYFDRSNMVATDHGLEKYEVFSDKDIFEQFTREESQQVTMIPRIKRQHYPYLLSICYPLPAEKGKSNGVAVVNIDVEKLGDFIGTGDYHPEGNNEGLFIFDETMEILVYSDEYRFLHESQELSELVEKLGKWKGNFSKIINLWDANYAVSGIQSERDGLRYVYLKTTKEFEASNGAIDQTLAGMMWIIVGVCLILALLLAKWVYRPIQNTIRILSDMSMMTEWDKKEHVDEIEAIQRSILVAKKEKDDLNEQIQERLITLHNAQICALQTQINPHFLYNTLEAIGNASVLLFHTGETGEISASGGNQVTDMIFTLGKLMRISLSSENYLVPLSEELEHVKLYMKLLEFRFHGKISMYQQIPEIMQDVRILKLTLQPLIENAVQHGQLRKQKEGKIWVKGEIKGKDMYIHVIDNGVGITEEAKADLLKQMSSSAITSSKHIAMRNVDQRIKLVFGEEYGISITTPEDGGTCITIHFRTM